MSRRIFWSGGRRHGVRSAREAKLHRRDDEVAAVIDRRGGHEQTDERDDEHHERGERGQRAVRPATEDDEPQ